jgi:hypothetical protein
VYVYIFTHIHNTEYYLAIKKNEITSFAGKWMDLKIVTLSEPGQGKKAK